MSVNKVILVGNVGKDPETRYLDEGTAISKFPMATSETYRNRDGERVSTTEWHNVVLWRGLAQVAEKYVRKGTQLYIEGRIKSRSYDDQDGNKRYITEIVGDQMQLLGRRPDGQGDPGMTTAGQSAPAQSQAAQTGQGMGTQSSQDPQAGQGDPQSGNGQDPQTGQGTAPQSGQGENKTPPADPGDPFDSGDNGPDDLPF